MTNEGVGPAVIADLRVEFDGKALNMDTLINTASQFPFGQNVTMAHVNTSQRGFVPAGGTERLLALLRRK